MKNDWGRGRHQEDQSCCAHSRWSLFCIGIIKIVTVVIIITNHNHLTVINLATIDATVILLKTTEVQGRPRRLKTDDHHNVDDLDGDTLDDDDLDDDDLDDGDLDDGDLDDGDLDDGDLDDDDLDDGGRDDGLPANSHQSHSHQVGKCHNDEGWDYDYDTAVTFPPFINLFFQYTVSLGRKVFIVIFVDVCCCCCIFFLHFICPL